MCTACVSMYVVLLPPDPTAVKYIYHYHYQKKSQLKQWHILISILSSVRKQPHLALLQIWWWYGDGTVTLQYDSWPLCEMGSCTQQDNKINIYSQWAIWWADDSAHCVCASVLNLLPQKAEVLQTFLQCFAACKEENIKHLELVEQHPLCMARKLPFLVQIKLCNTLVAWITDYKTVLSLQHVGPLKMWHSKIRILKAHLTHSSNLKKACSWKHTFVRHLHEYSLIRFLSSWKASHPTKKWGDGSLLSSDVHRARSVE